MPTKITIGTRGSALALHQTHWVADELRRYHPHLEIEIRTIQTHGDATQAANIPLSSFGEKGIFAKELETALLNGEIDLAVHSMKDLAHTLPEGLCIAAVPNREDPRDALIGATLELLPQGARVGTGSVRRRALLLSKRPDLQLLEIRGNIDTRLRKWREGQYDAICLAVAGLNRLGLQRNITEILDPAWFTPDPGQGALAIEARESAEDTKALLSVLSDPSAEITTRAERAFLQNIGGSCKTPVGAQAILSVNILTLDGIVAQSGGANIWRATASVDLQANTPEDLALTVTKQLRTQGAVL